MASTQMISDDKFTQFVSQHFLSGGTTATMQLTKPSSIQSTKAEFEWHLNDIFSV